MGRIRGKKPSPAMIVSVVALVFAVAGTSVAGVATISVLTKKEKKQTRNIAKDEINKAAPGLSVARAANADALGGKPASAYQEKPRWASVNSNGTILAQSGGITVSNPSAGLYFVDYGTPISGMFVSGTARGAGTIITAGPCGGPPLGVTCSEGNDPNHLVVNLRNDAGGPVGERFYIGVFP
jgi:hypothetical protein